MIAVLTMYAVYLLLLYWLCYRRIMGAVAGLLCAQDAGIWAIIRFSDTAELGGKMAVQAGIIGKLTTWLLKRI